MNSIHRHIPGFARDGREDPEIVEFDSTTDLLAIDWVNRFSDRKDFSHYALSENLLMAIYQEGAEWWVIGAVQNPALISLPEWKAPEKSKEKPMSDDNKQQVLIQMADRTIREVLHYVAQEEPMKFQELTQAVDENPDAFRGLMRTIFITGFTEGQAVLRAQQQEAPDNETNPELN